MLLTNVVTQHNSLQGGYHELQNETDGVPEKMAEECISWIEARIPASSQVEGESAVSKL